MERWNLKKFALDVSSHVSLTVKYELHPCFLLKFYQILSLYDHVLSMSVDIITIFGMQVNFDKATLSHPEVKVFLHIHQKMLGHASEKLETTNSLLSVFFSFLFFYHENQ